MKTLIIATIVFGAIVALLSIKSEGDHFKGYSQMVSRVIKQDNSNKAHDLDLTKYRPNFNGR